MLSPLLLEKVIALLAQIKGFSAFQFPILFPEPVQVHRAPETGSFPADDDDGGRVDGEKNRGSGSTVYRMGRSFAQVADLTTLIPHADDG
jgi:hypothetical protein